MKITFRFALEGTVWCLCLHVPRTSWCHSAHRSARTLEFIYELMNCIYFFLATEPCSAHEQELKESAREIVSLSTPQIIDGWEPVVNDSSLLWLDQQEVVSNNLWIPGPSLGYPCVYVSMPALRVPSILQLQLPAAVLGCFSFIVSFPPFTTSFPMDHCQPNYFHLNSICCWRKPKQGGLVLYDVFLSCRIQGS